MMIVLSIPHCDVVSTTIGTETKLFKFYQKTGVQRPTGLTWNLEIANNPLWITDYNAMSNQYLDLVELLRDEIEPSGMEFSLVIPFWFSDFEVTRNGKTKGLHEWVLDNVDRVVILTSRDWATDLRNSPDNSDSTNGRTDSIQELVKEEFSYAEDKGKKVVVMINTDPGSNYQTFQTEGTSNWRRVMILLLLLY